MLIWLFISAFSTPSSTSFPIHWQPPGITAVYMAEDSGSTKHKKIYYVTNPDSGDSEDEKEEYIRETGRNAYLNKQSLPQMDSVANFQYHRSNPTRPKVVVTAPSLTNSLYQRALPLLSPDSTSSLTTSTAPLATPGNSALSPSVDLYSRFESPSNPPSIPKSTTSYPEYRNYNENQHQTTKSRKGRLLQHLKPFGSPALKSSTTVTSTSTSTEKLIFVTTNSERYATVDISSAQNAKQIRELILTKLNIYNEDEFNPYSIYRTEIGSYAIGEVLTNERLFALCRDHGDSRGTLKFFVSRSSVPHESPPAELVEYNPIPPVLPRSANFNPLRVDHIDHRLGSKDSSFSSTSENLPFEVVAGYEAGPDYPYREIIDPPSLAHPPRPTLPILQSSKLATTPPQVSPSSDGSWSQEEEEEYGHTLFQAPPPLSPNRPTFSLEDESPSSIVPQLQRPHSQPASDAAADQESATIAAEQNTKTAGKQLRNRDHPALAKLKLSRDNVKDKQARVTYEEEDASWEIVVPGKGRPVDELDRIPLPVSRSPRQPNFSRYDKPNVSYASKNNLFPPRPPPPVSSTTLPIQDPRPWNQRRTTNVFVNWKGEDGMSEKTVISSASQGWASNRLGKTKTKSPYNPKLFSQSSPSRRNPPRQMSTRPPTNPPRELPYSSSLAVYGNLSLSGDSSPLQSTDPATLLPQPSQSSDHSRSQREEKYGHILPPGQRVVANDNDSTRHPRFQRGTIDTLNIWIGAEHALQHVQRSRAQIDMAFSDHSIEQSRYAVYAGFDESLIQAGVGYLEQIHVFTSANITASSPLLSLLGNIFSPFSSILFAESSSYRLPVYKSDGTSWEFDELVFETASKLADRGSTAAMYPTVISLSQTTGESNPSAPTSGGGSGSHDQAEKGKDRKGKGRERNQEDDEQNDDNSDEGPGEDPEGPSNSPDEPEPAAALKVSFDVVSEIYSTQLEDNFPKIFQFLNAQGIVTIQNGSSTTTQVQFTKLKFGSVRTTADTAYEQHHLRITMDSHCKTAGLTVNKPQRTPAFDRETKVVASTKTSWSIGASIGAALGLSPQATVTATTTRTGEQTAGLQKKHFTSRITQQDLYGTVWWGFYVDDPNEREGGVNMSDDTLPTATFEFRGSNNSTPGVPEHIDVEVASYWSIIPGHTRDLGWLTRILSHPSGDTAYSNLCQIIVLNIPRHLAENSNYNATVQVANRPHSLQSIVEVGDKTGPVEVIPKLTRRTGDMPIDYGDLVSESILELPSIRSAYSKSMVRGPPQSACANGTTASNTQ